MEYSLAPARSRVYAGMIDFVIVSVVSILITFPLLSVINCEFLDFDSYLNKMNNTLLFYVCEVMILIVINWHYLKDGQTIGMRLMDIKIKMTNYNDATLTTVILRIVISILLQWLIIGITVVNFGLLLFHPKKRTTHDLIAGTIVIKI